MYSSTDRIYILGSYHSRRVEGLVRRESELLELIFRKRNSGYRVEYISIKCRREGWLKCLNVVVHNFFLVKLDTMEMFIVYNFTEKKNIPSYKAGFNLFFELVKPGQIFHGKHLTQSGISIYL